MTFRIKSETYFVVRLANGSYIGHSGLRAALSCYVADVANAIKYPSHRGAARVANKLPSAKIEKISVDIP